MKYSEEQIAKIDVRHWILLSRGFEGEWTVEIWGAYPCMVGLRSMCEEDAKEQALCFAKQHLHRHGLSCEVLNPSKVSWRVAVQKQRVA
jgi:hypothetical protein